MERPGFFKTGSLPANTCSDFGAVDGGLDAASLWERGEYIGMINGVLTSTRMSSDTSRLVTTHCFMPPEHLWSHP